MAPLKPASQHKREGAKWLVKVSHSNNAAANRRSLDSAFLLIIFRHCFTVCKPADHPTAVAGLLNVQSTARVLFAGQTNL
jgi:hypothetical protein